MEIKAWNKILIKNDEYMILDVLKCNEKNYIYCSKLGDKTPIPKFFEYKILNESLKVREEKEKEQIKSLLKIVFEDSKKM